MSSTDAATRTIAKLASRQHGNVTAAQLREAGLTRNQVARRAAAGQLVKRHTGVYAVGHRPLTRLSLWLAAVLALGLGAVLSHRAAGALWGIVEGPVVTEVTVPPDTGRGRRDGIRVHRARLRPEDVVWLHGIPVTSLVRTMLDLAAVQSPPELERAFEQAQVLHHLAPEDVAVEVLCRRRSRGNGRLRRLLVDAVDPAKVRSALELRFLKMCEAQIIPRPLVNERIDGWELDFLWADAEVVVETDGERFHRTAAQRRRDAEKDAHFRGRGFTVIRLTWADVVEAPSETGAAVRAALAEATTSDS